MAKATKQALTKDEAAKLMKTLKDRFEKNINRHKNVEWKDVEKRLASNQQKLWSLQQMENSGGEPDVVSLDRKTSEVVFMDCSAESPSGRRSLCYDKRSLDERKENKPSGSAMELAEQMGASMLTEEEYRSLQEKGKYDLKTSSWIQTPADVRKLGGALFCDRRYEKVFVYHNGASSYYAARGFRCSLRV